MKLLIIAGPYEADRIRKAAVLGGFEAVAIEPGESLSGWITATRPDVIILAPQIVSGDPALALAKVRAVPRGRVPIFLVGEGEDQQRLQHLADGFFVRPVAADDLLAKAREAVSREAVGTVAGRDENDGNDAGSAMPGSGAQTSDGGVMDAAEGLATKTPTLRPLVSARTAEQPVLPDEAAQPGPFGNPGDSGNVGKRGTPEKPGKPGKPAKTAERWPPPMDRLPPADVGTPAAAPTLFDRLAEHIEADFDAELQEVVRTVGMLRQTSPAPWPVSAPSPSGALTNDSGQDPSKISHQVTAASNEAGRGSGAAPADAYPADGEALASSSATPATPVRQAALHDDAAGWVRARHDMVIEGDYFQILGVSRQASSAEIERAWRTLTAELAAASLDSRVAADWEAELQELRAAAAEAARLLGDERLRRQYREALTAPAMASAETAGASLSS